MLRCVASRIHSTVVLTLANYEPASGVFQNERLQDQSFGSANRENQIKGQHHVRAENNLDDRTPHHHHQLHSSHPLGRPKVMQHADPKSIDLSPSFKKDSAPLPPLPLLFPGVRWWVFVCFHALLCSSICRCPEAANGWRAYQGSGRPGTLAALSAWLSQQIPRTKYIFNSAGYLVVVARVMFNDNHFAVGPELHGGKAGRQAVWVVKCSPGHQKRVPKLQVFAVGVNIFPKLSVDVYVSANGCLSLFVYAALR